MSIVIHPSMSPATGRTLRSLPVKAFVVPPLSRQQVPGQGSGPANSCRAPAAQAMMIRRWAWPAPAGSFGGQRVRLPSAYTGN